jgi:predicted Zn-dependent protease
MTNVIRQMGAGIFFDIVFGGSGAGQAIAVASVNLASLRYSRGDEEEADARGLDYLDAAGIDSGGLARLFDRFGKVEHEGAEQIPTLLSSHPATPARAAAARARSRQGLQPSLNERDWRVVRQACGGAAIPSARDDAED